MTCANFAPLRLGIFSISYAPQYAGRSHGLSLKRYVLSEPSQIDVPDVAA